MNNELLAVLYNEYCDRAEWEGTPEIDAADERCTSILNSVRDKLTVEEYLTLEEAQIALFNAGQKGGCINGLRLGVRLGRELAGLPLAR